MSDTIGVIGQKYEDRKSKKVGIMLGRDAENKKLVFLDENGEQFSISYAAFKSNWRKVVSAEPVNTEVQWPEEEAEPETVFEEMTVEDDEDSKIKDFVKALTEARVASVDIIGDDVTIMADDVTVCTMYKVPGGYAVSMLPDIFIFSEWGNTFTAKDAHLNTKLGRFQCVFINCVRASLGDILQIIKTATVEMNLYGYTE